MNEYPISSVSQKDPDQYTGKTRTAINTITLVSTLSYRIPIDEFASTI